MVLNTAGGGGSAGVLVETGVSALVVDAGRVLRTVLIDSALNSDTANIGVTLQTRRTSAGSLVVGGVAFSIAGAGVVSDAGVKTLSVSTHFCDCTF